MTLLILIYFIYHQLEDAQTKRHEKLVETHKSILQQILDEKPKVWLL